MAVLALVLGRAEEVPSSGVEILVVWASAERTPSEKEMGLQEELWLV